ncbi:hypothetical protein J0871_00995 [Salegentibacter sp. BDJ18]|uniref:hypothetical protein n=1 Tax=Salegentibacter sp. BDJ18 TaxID=2816376 RepID=UPI001AAFA68E|nr:hypothetical protein [Salegentibacter sp. BDJ18]MBO2542981.1 hypothetical protein [Salegentibacter sp. BDJ18]
MKIKLDEENRQLKIDDNIKITYWMLKFVMFTNIFQMLLRVFKTPVANWDFLTWLWIPIGLVSLFTLYYFTNLSTKEVIPLDEIQHPILKNFFGRKRLSLKLKNGKARHIPTHSIKEMEQIQKFINSSQKATT